MTSLDQLPPCILLADDEEIVRTLLERALESDGHEVIAVATRAEAVAELERRVFDLLLVDKNLPDGSGLEIIEEAHRREHHSEAIVVTGYSDTDSAIQAVSLGVFRYVKKPFDLHTLRVDIKRALELGRLRRDLDGRTMELEITNRELREALDKVREAENRRVQAERLATLGYLAAGVAHEINNPLSLLSMSIPFAVNEVASLLAQREAGTLDDSHIQRSLQTMQRSLGPTQEAIEFLMGLSSDLHSLGRQDDLEVRSVPLDEAARSAMRLVRHQLKHRATLVLEVPDTLVVRGKANRLIQVFINLLTNAGKSISSGDPSGNEISVRGSEEEDEAVVRVSDTGVGIPAEIRERIFEPYFTEPGPDGEKGSGFGLAISKEIVEDHGGSISVESEPGRGTTFTIRLPLAPAEQRISTIPAVVRPDSAEMTRRRRTILFVDSEGGNLAAYERSFGQIHDVLLASGAEEAEDIVRSRHDDIDAIVCELAQPESPISKLREKAVRSFPDLDGRFVLLAEPDDTAGGAASPGLPILRKPVRPASLLAEIYRIPPRSPSSPPDGNGDPE